MTVTRILFKSVGGLNSKLLSSFIYISITVYVSVIRLFLRLKGLTWADHTAQLTVPRLGVVVWYSRTSLGRFQTTNQSNYRENSLCLCVREHMK